MSFIAAVAFSFFLLLLVAVILSAFFLRQARSMKRFVAAGGSALGGDAMAELGLESSVPPSKARGGRHESRGKREKERLLGRKGASLPCFSKRAHSAVADSHVLQNWTTGRVRRAATGRRAMKKERWRKKSCGKGDGNEVAGASPSFSVNVKEVHTLQDAREALQDAIAGTEVEDGVESCSLTSTLPLFGLKQALTAFEAVKNDLLHLLRARPYRLSLPLHPAPSSSINTTQPTQQRRGRLQ
jgi:hypothetical protein